MNRIWIIAATVAATTTLALPASAQWGWGWGSPGVGVSVGFGAPAYDYGYYGAYAAYPGAGPCTCGSVAYRSTPAYSYSTPAYSYGYAGYGYPADYAYTYTGYDYGTSVGIGFRDREYRTGVRTEFREGDRDRTRVRAGVRYRENREGAPVRSARINEGRNSATIRTRSEGTVGLSSRNEQLEGGANVNVQRNVRRSGNNRDRDMGNR